MSVPEVGVQVEGITALVTGGAGTIGSHVVDRLVAGGAERVIILDDLTRGREANLEAAEASGRVELVVGDIRDAALVTRLTRGCQAVFHLAAIRITQCAEDPRLAHDVLATGTFNVVAAARDAGVRKVVASSSASIYGLAEEFPTGEKHHPWANDTIYGAAKVYNEGLLRSFHAMSGLDYVALRYFNVYGPRMDVHGLYTEVLIRWMERIAQGEPPLVLGDGLQTMDFVDVRDIARANLLALEAPVTDRAYNIASSVETSLLELARLLAVAMGRPDLEPEFGPARKVNPVSRRLADVSAAERDLGWTPRVPLGGGLVDLVAWWREQ
ncbi:MAG: SDR family NAD(P)-dependent oxidoreductase [Candidatus Nanopelagicales bacterium]